MEIASGLQKFVTLEQMKGKVIVMANLKARKMGGF
jgi:tRNA-binding EMAP/Myf-like protein